MTTIRPMQAQDLAHVLRIQGECYVPHMNESEAVIRSRLDASPDTAWVFEVADIPVAYLVAYRSRVGKVTPLGSDFEISSQGDCLYVHDLAVSPRARGSGAGAALTRHAQRRAAEMGLEHSALVSVQNSQRFWETRGYRIMDKLAPTQRCHLTSYAVPCCYMTCRIEPYPGGK